MPESAGREAEDYLARYGLDAGAWEALRAVIRERSFSEGGSTTLASGQRSSFYFDMKRTLSLPHALNHAADLLLPVLYDGPCDYIGGLEMGAIPVLNAVAMRSAMPPHGKPLPLFWVRKQAKEHGTRRRIEGQDIADLQGRAAVMLEDVTTTGNSVLSAIREARESGLEIARVVTLVDRLEGAEANLAAAGVELIALFDAGHFRS